MQSDLATRADVNEAVDRLGRELRGELASKADLESLRVTLRDELARELKQHVNAGMEETRGWFRVLHDKVTAIAERSRDDVTQLRQEFERHRDDDQVHRRPRRRSR